MTKTVWFARTDDIRLMGPFETQERATKSVMMAHTTDCKRLECKPECGTIPAPGAFVWPETVEVTPDCSFCRDTGWQLDNSPGQEPVMRTCSCSLGQSIAKKWLDSSVWKEAKR